MDNVIKDFIDLAGKSSSVDLAIKEDQISAGRVIVRVFPSMDSDMAEMLFLEFPVDVSPEEGMIVMAFKLCLVGEDNFSEFMTRAKNSLLQNHDHCEVVGHWEVQLSERGSFETIQAKRIS